MAGMLIVLLAVLPINGTIYGTPVASPAGPANAWLLSVRAAAPTAAKGTVRAFLLLPPLGTGAWFL